MKSLKNLITVDKGILGGQPVFKGTRVPVESLFMHLEKGISVDEFLLDFPTVNKKQVIGLLEIAEKLLTSVNIEKIIEAVA
jgi:uncharacterized protein (DUF433 family)